MNRVMFGSVTVSGWPSITCWMNSGITDPRDAITLPYRVPQRIVPFGRARRDLARPSVSP